MKLISFFLMLQVLSACGDSDVNNFGIDEEGNIIGNFRLTKVIGSFMGKEDIQQVNQLWQFTEDSIYVHEKCFIDAHAKKEGSNYKETWYEIKEKVYHEDEFLVLEILMIEKNITSKYYFIPTEPTDEEIEFRNTKVNWSCAFDKEWKFDSASDSDRKAVRKEDLGFEVQEILNLRSENDSIFRISQDTLFYSTQSGEMTYKLMLLQDFGQMRLVPISQCECSDIFLDYISIK